MSAVAPPTTIAQLNERLEEVAREFGVPVARARRMLCTLIVSQMLPDSVAVKGGMGVKLRLGERGTRATADLDVSTHRRGDDFEKKLRTMLAQGWGEVPASRGALRKDPAAPNRVAFTAALKPRPLHDPGLSQPQYVMHPYRVTISFLGREWSALDVEVSDPEIEAHAHSPRKIDGDLAVFTSVFAFGELRPVELIDLEHQIAQKIHAVTDLDYTRAHDLVDLQLLCTANPDLIAVREFCTRTFAFRGAQSWPPLPVRPMGDWAVAYDVAREETEVDGGAAVKEGIESAREWFRQLVLSVDAAVQG